MATYDPFTDAMWNEPAVTRSKCASCQHRPSLETASVGSSTDSISTISSYEDGWDDHEGPQWNDPLDAEAVAEQAGLSGKRDQSHTRTPSRCRPQSERDEKHQRCQNALANPTVEQAVACPPDIEEIDLYMPSVEHRWFNTPEVSGKTEDFGAVAVQHETEIEIKSCSEQRSDTNCSGHPNRRTKGCGYSCKLYDVRRSGLAKSDGTSHMIEVSRGAW